MNKLNEFEEKLLNEYDFICVNHKDGIYIYKNKNPLKNGYTSTLKIIINIIEFAHNDCCKMTLYHLNYEIKKEFKIIYFEEVYKWFMNIINMINSETEDLPHLFQTDNKEINSKMYDNNIYYTAIKSEFENLLDKVFKIVTNDNMQTLKSNTEKLPPQFVDDLKTFFNNEYSNIYIEENINKMSNEQIVNTWVFENIKMKYKEFIKE